MGYLDQLRLDYIQGRRVEGFIAALLGFLGVIVATKKDRRGI
jgi:hypothetical protein